MLALLITAIVALFTFLTGVVADPALPNLQKAQEKIVASPPPQVLPEDENTSSDTNDNGENGNSDENGDSGEPEDNKVPTFNTAAGFVLPTMVAQVAVDNSPVLIGCDKEPADCEDTSPGNSAEAQDSSGNGENGLVNSSNGNIGLAKAEEAKSNRP